LSSRHENLELRFSGICMDIDPTTGRLLYSTAAHPSPLLQRCGGGIEELPSGGGFVGVRSNVTFPRFEAALDAGDNLLLYTDGLLDATCANGELFGEERMRAAIARPDLSEPASATLVRSLSDFVGQGHALTDDTTILDVRRLATP
jgi:phosphoserine phosphatase RsbU/P